MCVTGKHNYPVTAVQLQGTMHRKHVDDDDEKINQNKTMIC